MTSHLDCGEHHVHGPECYRNEIEDWARHMEWCRVRCESGAWHRPVTIDARWIFCPVCGRQIRSDDGARPVPSGDHGGGNEGKETT